MSTAFRSVQQRPSVLCGCEAALWWNPAREPAHDEGCPKDPTQPQVLGQGMPTWDGSAWVLVRPEAWNDPGDFDEWQEI